MRLVDWALWLHFATVCGRTGEESPKPCHVIVPAFGAVLGGHALRCFRGRPMNFEACKLLLGIRFAIFPPSLPVNTFVLLTAHYAECSMMSYSKGMCSLHANTTSDFSFTRMDQFQTRSINELVFRKHPRAEYGGHSHQTELVCPKFSNLDFTARQGFGKCLQKQHHSRTPTIDSKHTDQVDQSNLIRLAIVMSVTENWVQQKKAGFAAAVSNFECYAELHNYSFVVNRMPSMSSAAFFHKRHSDVLAKYLHQYQYVMHVDADSLVVNLHRPLSQFLDEMEGSDVLLHIHESGEVTASNYIVKNSLYGRCFLQYWASMRPTAPRSDRIALEDVYFNTLNFDNGDLMGAVMNAVSPSGYLDCMGGIGSLSERELKKYSNPYLELMVECWKHMVTSPGRRSDYLTFTDAPNFDAVSAGLKIYLPRQGFWRTFGRKNRFGGWWDELFNSCYHGSDIIVHGWKAMPRVMWGAQRECSVERDRGGLNDVCNWLSAERELEISEKYCFSKSTKSLCALNSFDSSSDTRNQKIRKGFSFDVGDPQWWKQQLCHWRACG